MAVSQQIGNPTTALHVPKIAENETAAHAVHVANSRIRQLHRQGCANAFLDLAGLRQHCSLQAADQQWLETACERLALSLRAAHRVLKVARTLADLEDVTDINRQHLAEAMHYRGHV